VATKKSDGRLCRIPNPALSLVKTASAPCLDSGNSGVASAIVRAPKALRPRETVVVKKMVVSVSRRRQFPSIEPLIGLTSSRLSETGGLRTSVSMRS
jgi:hypothetical protein